MRRKDMAWLDWALWLAINAFLVACTAWAVASGEWAGRDPSYTLFACIPVACSVIANLLRRPVSAVGPSGVPQRKVMRWTRWLLWLVVNVGFVAYLVHSWTNGSWERYGWYTSAVCCALVAWSLGENLMRLPVASDDPRLLVQTLATARPRVSAEDVRMGRVELPQEDSVERTSADLEPKVVVPDAKAKTAAPVTSSKKEPKPNYRGPRCPRCGSTEYLVLGESLKTNTLGGFVGGLIDGYRGLLIGSFAGAKHRYEAVCTECDKRFRFK